MFKGNFLHTIVGFSSSMLHPPYCGMPAFLATYVAMVICFLHRKKWVAIVDLERPNEPTARRKLLRDSKWETSTLRWSPHTCDCEILLASVSWTVSCVEEILSKTGGWSKQ